jgi:hypothetical protein
MNISRSCYLQIIRSLIIVYEFVEGDKTSEYTLCVIMNTKFTPLRTRTGTRYVQEPGHVMYCSVVRLIKPQSENIKHKTRERIFFLHGE